MPDCTDTPILASSEVALGTPAHKPLTARALAKQSTRAKLLQAARQLFTEQGYEGATIRDIAAAAGMSTGAVFANFTEKFDLFREIAADDMARLAQAMRDGASAGKTVDEALLGIFTAGYAYYVEQLPLARAKLAVGWNETEGRELRKAMPRDQLLTIVAEALDQGVRRGELGGDIETPLRTRMLFELYISNFRDLIFEDWGMDAVRGRMADQIRIVLAGVRAKATA